MSPIDIRQRAITLLDQLPQNKLAAVVQLLEVLAEPTPQTPANSEEAQLLAVIQQHLPEPEQVRLDDLRDRCEWGELSEAEHQELIHYEDLLEQHRVERLEALMNLAKLSIPDLLNPNQPLSPQTKSLDTLTFDPTATPIWELAARLSAQVSDEDWEQLPTDLAKRFDDYQKQRQGQD